MCMLKRVKCNLPFILKLVNWILPLINNDVSNLNTNIKMDEYDFWNLMVELL